MAYNGTIKVISGLTPANSGSFALVKASDVWVGEPDKRLNDTISDITGSYAPLASPAFTGTPTAPTATSGTNTTQIATTAYVVSAIDSKLTSTTKLSNASSDATETSGRVYPVRLDKNSKLAVNVPWTDSKPVTSVAGKTGAVTLSNSDVGLGSVENKSSSTIRSEITSSNVTVALGFTPMNASLKGATNGVAELGSDGKVPSSQLPSYVDDVLEYANLSSFPATGETGKIYIAQDTNKTYRWSGSAYVEISASLALGATSSTAFRGDYGNSAYAHAVTNKGSAFSSGLYKITTNNEGHVTAATSVEKSDITALGIPASDTNTHRPIWVDGSMTLASNETPLNLKSGNNVTLSRNAGEVTISATDTQYSSLDPLSGGTAVSLVTNGEKYNWNNKADATDTVLATTLSHGRSENTTVGAGSIAYGQFTTASGSYSQAFGFVASATADYAHAEGHETRAEGESSHAEGEGTVALSTAQHVEGKYNLQNIYHLHIVGNGTATNARSNAYVLDKDSNGRYGGDVYVNCNADSTGGNKLATEQYVQNSLTAITNAQIDALFA